MLPLWTREFAAPLTLTGDGHLSGGPAASTRPARRPAPRPRRSPTRARSGRSRTTCARRDTREGEIQRAARGRYVAPAVRRRREIGDNASKRSLKPGWQVKPNSSARYGSPFMSQYTSVIFAPFGNPVRAQRETPASTPRRCKPSRSILFFSIPLPTPTRARATRVPPLIVAPHPRSSTKNRARALPGDESPRIVEQPGAVQLVVLLQPLQCLRLEIRIHACHDARVEGAKASSLLTAASSAIRPAAWPTGNCRVARGTGPGSRWLSAAPPEPGSPGQPEQTGPRGRRAPMPARPWAPGPLQWHPAVANA